jgi:hypothetical protein
MKLIRNSLKTTLRTLLVFFAYRFQVSNIEREEDNFHQLSFIVPQDQLLHYFLLEYSFLQLKNLLSTYLHAQPHSLKIQVSPLLHFLYHHSQLITLKMLYLS